MELDLLKSQGINLQTKDSMSKLRSLNTRIWNDTWFEELSVDRKLLFIYLITNEKTNMLGIYEISIRKISFETGIPADKITESFVYFEKSEKIKYQNNRVILLNFLKHQNYNLNMKKSAIDCYNDLPNSLKIDGKPLLERDAKGFETLCKGFGMVRKIEEEIEYELEEEKEEEEISDFIEFGGLKFPKSHIEHSKSVISNEISLQTFMQQNSIKNIDGVKSLLMEFNKHLNVSGEHHKESKFKEYRQHFVNWYRRMSAEGKDSLKSNKKGQKLPDGVQPAEWLS